MTREEIKTHSDAYHFHRECALGWMRENARASQIHATLALAAATAAQKPPGSAPRIFSDGYPGWEEK